MVEAIRGDSVWLNTRRILNSIKNPTNSANESRRKWYNQINATEDAWCDPKDVAAGKRDFGLDDGDAVVLFGDGSKSDDATGLIAVPDLGRSRSGVARAAAEEGPDRQP